MGHHVLRRLHRILPRCRLEENSVQTEPQLAGALLQPDVSEFKSGGRAADATACVGSGDGLIAGIWPRSVALWMAAFYIALFILRPWEQPALEWLNNFHFERVYAIAMIMVALLSLATSRPGRWTPLAGHAPVNYQNVAVVLFVTALSLSTLFGQDFDLAWEKYYAALTIVIFYFVLRMVIRTPYELMFMVTCYIVAMGVYLIKAQWEYSVYGRHDYTMGVTRLIGIEASHGGPNGLAIAIIISLPLWLFLWSSRTEFTATWPTLWRRLYTPGLAVYFVLAISSMIMTRSRTGFVTFVMLLGLIALRTRGIGRKIVAGLAGLALLGIVWFVVSDEARNRIRTIWNPEAGPADAYASAVGRLEGLYAGLEMFNKHIVTGVGLGNFIPYRVVNLDGVHLEAHNLVGQVLGETGLLGAGAFLLMVSIIFVNCRQIRTIAGLGLDPHRDLMHRFSTACSDTMILLLFEGLFDHNLTRFNWLWLAAFSSIALKFAAVMAEDSMLEGPVESM
jgi:O-antigen ligase